MEYDKNECRMFSIELISKTYLKRVTMSNGTCENIVIEGTIGKLIQVDFIEGIVLEITGDMGVLKIDLGEDELRAGIGSHCHKKNTC